MSSEHFREFSVKFRGFRKIIGNPRKTLGRFRIMAIMERRKSHAFDPEKVGRYMVVNLQETFVKVYLFNKAVLSMIFQVIGEFFQR